MRIFIMSAICVKFENDPLKFVGGVDYSKSIPINGTDRQIDRPIDKRKFIAPECLSVVTGVGEHKNTKICVARSTNKSRTE